MRIHIALGVACAGIVSMLALSACTNGSTDPTASSDPNTAWPTASPVVVDPGIPIASSQAAGIPTSEPSPAAPADPTTLDASVVITLATADPDGGGLLVGGYVSGVMEDGGDCQYVITSAAGDSLTVHKDGVENNGSTSCGSTSVARSQVPSGSYTVLLRYVNDIGEAVSESVKVELP